jgi:hypothetical protein
MFSRLHRRGGRSAKGLEIISARYKRLSPAGIATVNLGSELIDHNQKMKLATSCMADRNVGALVVAGVDAPPVLEACEHVLDAVALPIERAIVTVLNFAASTRRNARCYAVFDERLPEPAGIIASMGEA